MTYQVMAHELITVTDGTAISMRLQGPGGHYAHYTVTHEEAAKYPVGSPMSLTPGKV